MIDLSRLRLAGVGLWLALAATVTPGLAQGRHALVIGIDAYQAVTPLQKAVGDAKAMQQALVGLGFDVDLAVNPDRRAFNRAIADFEKKLQPGDVALVHYSGHGVEIGGQNYLLPADIPKPEAGDSDFLVSEAVSLQDLVQRIASAGAATRIFIIDACRDNPFDPTGSRSLGAGRGLARVEAPAGTFILYSAGYHETALDALSDSDPSPTSVYTRVLIGKLTQTEEPISAIAKDVRADVQQLAQSVGHEQRPAYYDELSGDFFFRDPGAPPKPVPPPAPAPAAPAPASGSADNTIADAQAFQVAQSINTAAAWQVYLNRFPSGFYADMARAALAKISVPVPAPAPAAAPAPAPARVATREADPSGVILDFVTSDYLAGDLGDAGHLRTIYGDTVDYYGMGPVPLATIVADKAAYVHKWPSVRYDLVPGTFAADPIGAAGTRYLVTFESDFTVSNATRSLAGTSQTRLIVDLTSGRPVILDEKGTVVSRR